MGRSTSAKGNTVDEEGWFGEEGCADEDAAEWDDEDRGCGGGSASATYPTNWSSASGYSWATKNGENGNPQKRRGAPFPSSPVAAVGVPVAGAAASGKRPRVETAEECGGGAAAGAAAAVAAGSDLERRRLSPSAAAPPAALAPKS